MGRFPRYLAWVALFSSVGSIPSLSLALQRQPRVPRDTHLRGQVVYAGSNAPAANVYVALVSEGGEIVRDGRTGATGRFEFDRVPGAVYYVEADMPGFHKAQSDRLDLTMQQRGYVMLTLYPKKDEGLEPGSTQPMVGVESLAVPAEARAEFDLAIKAFDNGGDFETGQRHLQEAVRLYPEYYQAHHLLGTSYLDQGRWVEAEQALRRALEINQGYAPSHFALAMLYREQGRDEEARAELQQGVQSDPNSWKAQFELAEILVEEGKTKEAGVHARRAHELAPEEPMVHVLLANVRLKERDLAGAKEEFKHYLERAPDGAMVTEVKSKIAEIEKLERRSGLQETEPATRPPVPTAAQREYGEGKKALDRQELDEALKHLRKATEIHPAYVEAHQALGAVLMDQQKWPEAEAAFKRCMELDANYAPAYVGLGALYNLEQKPAEAVPMLERGVELDRESWQGHFELAQSLLAQREVAKADIHAQRAHELRPQEPLVHVVLGNIKLSRRMLRPARDEFQHYVDLAPDGPMAPALREKIVQIDAALEKVGASKP